MNPAEAGTKSNRCGILYVATGPRYVAEAAESARSVREHMPGIPILLHTDQQDLPTGVFDEVRQLEAPRHSFVDKIAPLRSTPFERTLFLDTDTLVCHPAEDLFEILDRFALAAAHAPMRTDAPFTTPNCFAELNTGVLAYRLTPEIDGLFADWLARYKADFARTGFPDSDQPTFRSTLYESGIPFYVLPSEYNLRTVMPGSAGRQRVRIIHGRAPDLRAVADLVNASRDTRVFLPDSLSLTARHLGVLSEPGARAAALLNAVVQPFVVAERMCRSLKRRFLKPGKCQ